MNKNKIIYLSMIISITALLISAYLFFQKTNNFIVYAKDEKNDLALKTAMDIQDAFRGIAKRSIPKVVRVDVVYSGESSNKNNFYNIPDSTGKKQRSFGSGFIVEQNGEDIYALTNNHVIEGALEIKITLFNNKEYVASIVGVDSRTDIGLLKFNSKEQFDPLSIGKSNEVKVGDWAIGIGNPFGYDGSLTVGVVSALGRAMYGKIDATDFIQTDAAINPGNSGGPLLNISGEVIGITSWIATQTGSNTGLSFAVPIDVAMIVYNKLKANNRVDYPWLGIGIKSLTDTSFRKSIGVEREYGVYITEIFRDSPAEISKLKVGDIIVGVDEKTITDTNELIWTISRYSPGDNVEITFFRDEKMNKITVELAKRPGGDELSEKDKKPAELEYLGSIFKEIDDNIAQIMKIKEKNGVIITQIDPASPSKKYGLEIGDVVKKINKTNITNISDMLQFVEDSNKNEISAFYFYIIRNGREQIIGVMK